MKLKSFLGAVLLFLCTTAIHAQLFSVTSVGITNAMAADTTNTVGITNLLDYHRDVGLVLRAQGSAADTGNITVTLVRSANGTLWETTPKITWVVALNGTAEVVAVTNLQVHQIGAMPYLKVLSIVNAATNSATNLQLSIVRKAVRVVQ